MKSLSWIVLIGLLGMGPAQAQTPQEWLENMLSDPGLQATASLETYQNIDFTPLFIHTPPTRVLGFIGNSFQRLHMALLTVIRDPEEPYRYRVAGKSMVSGNVCDFLGELIVEHMREGGVQQWGIEAENGGIIAGRFSFHENPSQSHVGRFEGVFVAAWRMDESGKVRYDDRASMSADFANNQFVGTWTMYGRNDERIVRWGDGRIPLAGTLDVGVDVFGPAEAFFSQGWESYVKGIGEGDSTARAIEHAKWWKD